jgi:hypothetical protein
LPRVSIPFTIGVGSLGAVAGGASVLWNVPSRKCDEPVAYGLISDCDAPIDARVEAASFATHDRPAKPRTEAVAPLTFTSPHY